MQHSQVRMQSYTCDLFMASFVSQCALGQPRLTVLPHTGLYIWDGLEHTELVMVNYVIKAGHPHNIYHSIHCLPVCNLVDVMQMTSLHYVLGQLHSSHCSSGPD